MPSWAFQYRASDRAQQHQHASALEKCTARFCLKAPCHFRSTWKQACTGLCCSLAETINRSSRLVLVLPFLLKEKKKKPKDSVFQSIPMKASRSHLSPWHGMAVSALVRQGTSHELAGKMLPLHTRYYRMRIEWRWWILRFLTPSGKEPAELPCQGFVLFQRTRHQVYAQRSLESHDGVSSFKDAAGNRACSSSQGKQ